MGREPAPMHAAGAIVLVSMPFVSLPRPSLALGMLKSCLARHGLAARVEYGHLQFARRVGLAAYGLANASPVSLLGEWAFAGNVFPDFHPDHAAFLHSQQTCPSVQVHSQQQVVEEAWRLRRESAAFIEEMAQDLLAGGARIVGCTSTFQQNLASLALLKKIQQLDPTVITVMGGANCEGPMGQAMVEKFPWLDFLVSGEADELVGPFFASLLEGGRQAAARQLPYGVMSRWAETPPGPAPRASVADMSQLPMPDFSDYFSALDRLGLSSAMSVSLPVENARGCWWGQKHHCTFCGLNGRSMNFRSRPSQQAEEQFHCLAERHGVKQFIVADNIMDVGYFKTLLPALARAPQNYDIFYETKANLKRDQLEQCARSGVRWIQPGLESLSDELLRMMDKGTTALQNLQTLKWSRELGIHVNWLMLVAFPGDLVEWYTEMARILPLLVHLQPPRSVVRVGYHRFSPYFERAADFGIEPVPEPGYAYVYPFSAEEVARLAYYFVDRRYSQKVSEIVEVMGQALRLWKHRFWNEGPILSMDDDGEVLRILDTRNQAWPVRSEHQGLARQILVECESIRSCSSLYRSLLEGGLAQQQSEIDQALGALEEMGLLLRRGTNLLGLAVPGPLPSIPSHLPLGEVKQHAWPEPQPACA